MLAILADFLITVIEKLCYHIQDSFGLALLLVINFGVI